MLDRVLFMGEQPPFGRPFQPEKKFLNAIGMKQVVQGHVPEHDEHGIVTVLSMLGCSRPCLGRKYPKTRDKGSTIFGVSLQRIVKIHV
jgi:hypothetical protein